MSAEFANINAHGFAHSVVGQCAYKVAADSTFAVTDEYAALLEAVAKLGREVALLEAWDTDPESARDTIVGATMEVVIIIHRIAVMCRNGTLEQNEKAKGANCNEE
jgi:hypothetical protein